MLIEKRSISLFSDNIWITVKLGYNELLGTDKICSL